MPIINDEFTLYVGSPMRGGPDSLYLPLVGLIDSALSEIYVASHQLEHYEIVDALVRARQRGCRVQIVLERDNLRERTPATDPWVRIARGNERNRDILAVLLRSNISVRFDRTYNLLHTNFIIADQSVALTSANLTERGLEEYFNSVLITTNTLIRHQTEIEFSAIWEDRTITPSERELSATPGSTLSFSPTMNPENILLEEINKANDSLLIAVFTFSTSSPLAEAIYTKCMSGVRVVLIGDTDQITQRWSPANTLISAGADIRSLGGEGQRLHHKFIIRDDVTLSFGSFNFTSAARRYNEWLARFDSTIEPNLKPLIKYFSAEFERLCGISASLVH